MVTVEERRDSARMVRGFGNQTPYVWATIRKMLSMPSDYGIPQIREHLASLIEPELERTCHVVPMDAAGRPPYRKGHLILNEMSDGCSACGYPFDTANKGVPNYCPNCGAKVVGE